ncbi:MAG: ion transporter [Chromatiaceae bacterium]
MGSGLLAGRAGQIRQAELACRRREAELRDEEIRFFFRPLSLIDLMAVVPFYLPVLGVDLRTVRLFRMFRVLRVLKLGRYSKAFHIIRHAIVGKKEKLIITAVALAVLLLLSASLLFFAERSRIPDETRLTNIPSGVEVPTGACQDFLAWIPTVRS